VVAGDVVTQQRHVVLHHGFPQPLTISVVILCKQKQELPVMAPVGQMKGVLSASLYWQKKLKKSVNPAI